MNLPLPKLKLSKILYNLLQIFNTRLLLAFSITNDFDTHHTCLSLQCLEKDFFNIDGKEYVTFSPKCISPKK